MVAVGVPEARDAEAPHGRRAAGHEARDVFAAEGHVVDLVAVVEIEGNGIIVFVLHDLEVAWIGEIKAVALEGIVAENVEHFPAVQLGGELGGSLFGGEGREGGEAKGDEREINGTSIVLLDVGASYQRRAEFRRVNEKSPPL